MSVLVPRKLDVEKHITIGLPRKWITNKKTEAYSSQVQMPYLQTPWLVLEGKWGASGDVVLEPPSDKQNDFTNQKRITQLRECLDDMTNHISKLFRDQIYRDFKIFLGDDAKVYGLLKHNYNTKADFIRLRRARDCETSGKQNNGISPIRAIFSVSAIHLIDDKISFSLQAHMIEYGETNDDDDNGVIVFDADDMW